MHYNLMIHGSGLSLLVDGEKKAYGFYVNRLVEALSENEAKAIGLARLKEEVLVKYGEAASKLLLQVEEVAEVEPARGLSEPEGFLLFPEESQDKPWWKFW